MKLEDQVCSLELAKRLKELGVKQDSLFWYKRWIPEKGSTYFMPEWKLSLYSKSTVNEYEYISAFTVAELGEMLPTILKNDDRLQLGWAKIINDNSKIRWKICYCNPSLPYEEREYFEDKNEANVRAIMVISLIEQGLLDVADLSKHT